MLRGWLDSWLDSAAQNTTPLPAHRLWGEEECDVEHYLILARSVTYAQRMQRALERAGIRSRIFRAPRDLTDAGCAYALRLGVRDLREALTVLHEAGLDPLQVFLYQKGLYREVGA